MDNYDEPTGCTGFCGPLFLDKPIGSNRNNCQHSFLFYCISFRLLLWVGQAIGLDLFKVDAGYIPSSFKFAVYVVRYQSSFCFKEFMWNVTLFYQPP